MARKKSKQPARSGRTKSGGLDGITEIWSRYRDQRNAAEAVYMALREAILHGVLAAEQSLPEIKLAELFGRSRTPVREAILRLEAEGLATRYARRGLVVAQITREEVLEVYAVREVLDGLAAELAALGILPNELDSLSWLNNRMRVAAEAGDAKALVNLNIEFHEAICRASRNSLLLEFMRRIHEWVHRFQDSTMAVPGRALEAVAEHEAIIEALRARDPEAAERIARSHMREAQQIRISMIQSARANN